MTYFYGRRQGNGCEIQFRALLYAREVLISRTVAHKKINELMSNFFCDLLADKICIASALSPDTRGARWEEFSREKENYRQRSVQQQCNNGDFLERVGAVRD
jgi:hypothetical protein